MEKFYNLPHHNQAFNNQKIKKYLSEFSEEEAFHAYGFFWFIMEIIHQEKNKISLPLLEDSIITYLLETDVVIKFDITTYVDLMIKAELIKKEVTEDGVFLFSPYQRLVAQMKENHQNKLSETNQKLNERVTQQEGLIKRLNDKIDFLKSNKKQIKENIIKTKF